MKVGDRWFDARIEEVYFGKYLAKSEEQVKEKIKHQIENLHPLNTTADPTEVERYRNRFRGKEIIVRVDEDLTQAFKQATN